MNCQSDLKTCSRWSFSSTGQGAAYGWRGHPSNDIGVTIARCLSEPGSQAIGADSKIAELRGNFALVVETDEAILAAVDHIRSIPLFYALTPSGWIVDDNANRLRRRAKIGLDQIDDAAALSVAMSGCTLGAKTLYRGLEVLLPGELVVLQRNRPARRRYYSRYQPWLAEGSRSQRTEAELSEVTLGIFERMFDDIKGRPLLVPLSAGFDSRLIVAMAKHFGHPDVRCFTYGRTGNFEAKTSKDICDRLGYDWLFVPSTTTSMRSYFESELHEEYLDFADDATSVAFVQDLFALDQLRIRKLLPKDAVVVNGQSGDFISGNHIPNSMSSRMSDLPIETRRERLFSEFVGKHFSLWSSLKSKDNLQVMSEMFWNQLSELDGLFEDPNCDYAYFEHMEFLNRQSKYVVDGQRSYDFLDLDWRLPLWDADYLDFWQTVPLEQKRDQNLYRSTLVANDWGNVWKNLPVNNKTIRPYWLAALRQTTKMAFVPLGKSNWHKFERRYFQYWMDVTCHTAVVPYAKWSKDERGARNALSWLTEQFLARHEVILDQFISGENRH